MNQKYMCLSIGALEDSKIIPINAKPKEIGKGYFKNE